MTRLLAKITGPKVLLGVIIAATAAITFLAAQWQSALESKANAQQNANTYERALNNTRAQLERANDQRRALTEVIAERRAREEAARRRAAAAESRLAELEATNDEVSRWSHTLIPDDALGWLRDDT